MDHLLLPTHPVYPDVGPYRAPYVCIEPYDGGDFLTYTERVQFQNVLPHEDKSPFFWLEQIAPSDDKTVLEPFFQSWIFFGLLHELLAPFGLYEESHFVETVGQDMFVHTKNLKEKIDLWLAQVENLNHQQKIILQTHLIECLALVSKALRCLLPSAENGLIGHPDFNRAIRWSLVTICETVSFLGDMHLDADPDHDWIRFTLFAKFNDAEREHMKQNGWCLASITHAEMKFGSAAGHLLLLYTKMPVLDVDHTECTTSTCRHMQIDPNTYKLRHVEASCDCSVLGPELTKVAKYLDASSFPLLRVEGSGRQDVTLEVEGFESEESTPYVALSHVWSDGLGNQEAIALQRCQILRLWDLIKSLEGQTFKWGAPAVDRIEKGPLRLWCDSLLCPVEISPPAELTEQELTSFKQRPDVKRASELKRAALRKMRDVYEEAKYVLVLDRALANVSISEVGQTEATIRLLVCGWMQRLWTYQEAILPKKLLIQYADGPVDFRTLWQQAANSYRSDSVRRALHEEVVSGCTNLRPKRTQASQTNDFSLLQSTIGNRKFSVARDEPHCTATILGLDVTSIIASGDREERMASLWQLISDSLDGVPRSIIYSACPRLSKPGFRWAPSSFQRDVSRLHLGMINYTNAEPAKATDLGLQIQRSCVWHLEPGRAPWGANSCPVWAPISQRDFIHARDAGGTWYTLSHEWTTSSPTRGPTLWHLITELDCSGGSHVLFDSRDSLPESQIGQDPYTSGLVGSYEQRTQKCAPIFHSNMLVFINTTHPFNNTLLTLAAQSALEIQQSPPFRAYQICHFIDLCTRVYKSHPASARMRVTVRWWKAVRTMQCMMRMFGHARLIYDSGWATREMAALTPKPDIGLVVGYIALHLSGQFATITEEVELDRVCVD